MVNFSYGLDESHFSGASWSKEICRKGMQPWGRDEVTWRKGKLGFPAPTKNFIVNNREYFSSLFLKPDCRSGEFLDSKKVAEKILADPSDSWVWRAISIELWMRRFDVDI